MRLLKRLLWYRAASGLSSMAFTMYVYHSAKVPIPKYVSNNKHFITFTNPRPIILSTLLTPQASAKQWFWQSSEVNPSLPYTNVKYASALMLYPHSSNDHLTSSITSYTSSALKHLLSKAPSWRNRSSAPSQRPHHLPGKSPVSSAERRVSPGQALLGRPTYDLDPMGRLRRRLEVARNREGRSRRLLCRLLRRGRRRPSGSHQFARELGGRQPKRRGEKW